MFLGQWNLNDVPKSKWKAVTAALDEHGYVQMIERAKQTFWEQLELPQSSLQSKTSNRVWEANMYMRRMLYAMDRSGGATGPPYLARLQTGSGYMVASPDFESKSIELVVVSNVELDDEVQDLKSLIAQSSKQGDEVPAWAELRPPNEGFERLSEETKPETIDSTTRQVATELTDSSLRHLIMTIKSAGGSMLRHDLEKKLNTISDLQSVADKARQLGLIDSEFVIICRQTSEQLNRIHNAEAVEMMGSHGVRCSRCGRSVTEERVEELLVSTDTANYMLNGSRWMTAHLVDILLSLGIPEDDILVGVKEGPDEIDAFVRFWDRLLMFELKDGQFSMRHAYAFGGRIGIYRPHHGIIWAAEGVAPEVKSHFEKAKPDAEIHYVESLDGITPFIKGLMNDIRWSAAEEVLARRLASSGIIVFDLPSSILADLRSRETTQARAAAAEDS